MREATRRKARKRRTILRGRRRLGWDTGDHPNLCGCVDCNALYGFVHAPLCRCDECSLGAFLMANSPAGPHRA